MRLYIKSGYPDLTGYEIDILNITELKVKVKVPHSCLTLCDLMDFTVHGIPQARVLEWVAYPFSSGSSRPKNRTRVSCIAGGFFTN